MLHIILLWTISSSQNVCVNVTNHSMNNIQLSNCLCECYISFYEQYLALKLFMWMLHIILWTISSSQTVHVNVTYHSMNSNIKFSKCLCKCYISFYEQYPAHKLFMWMLHIIQRTTISSSQNVCANVTYHSMWRLRYMNNIQFSNCLCKCYISFYEQYPALKLFMWVLHISSKEQHQVLRMFMCECYIPFNEQYPVLKMFVCVDASLHDSLQKKKKKLG
jgi:hypothetical protein